MAIFIILSFDLLFFVILQGHPDKKEKIKNKDNAESNK